MRKTIYLFLFAPILCASLLVPGIRIALANSGSDFVNSVRSIFIENGDGSAYTQITIPNSQTSNIKLTLPSSAGSNGEYLQTDGVGNLSWSAATAVAFPAGTIVAYAGSVAPSGWVEADGRTLDKTTYSALFAAIGSTWDTAKNPLTGSSYGAPAANEFRVPDLRGAFLRGTGGPNAAGVTTSLAGYQADTTARPTNAFTTGTESATHTHTDNGHPHSTTATNTVTGASTQTTSGSNFHLPVTSNTAGTVGTGYADLGTQSANHTHTVTGGGDAETRPDNVGVKYIIKF